MEVADRGLAIAIMRLLWTFRVVPVEGAVLDPALYKVEMPGWATEFRPTDTAGVAGREEDSGHPQGISKVLGNTSPYCEFIYLFLGLLAWIFARDVSWADKI